jgi:FkbM family methyltransferase
MHYLGLEPPKWDFTVKTVFGSTICGNTRDIIGKYLYYFGVWEPNLTGWIERRLAPRDVFIDVGANIGYYTLLASKIVGGSGKVVSIEALPATFAALQNNLKINKAHNVRAVNSAAWDREERLTIYTRPEDLAGQSTVMPDWARQWSLEDKSEVDALPLSIILKPEEIRVARLIKIDVEGAEWRVLMGMKALIAKSRNDLEIIVEVTPQMLRAENKTVQDVLDFFHERGFHAYRLENDYSVGAYIHRGRPSLPKRITHELSEQTDVIFSRIDAEAL